jgi:hypothetical protein
VASFDYLTDLLFCFFVEQEAIIPPKEDVIRHNILSVELKLNICDV